MTLIQWLRSDTPYPSRGMGRHPDLPLDMNTITERAMAAHNSQKTPTTLSALAAIVGRPFQRQGLSSAILDAMKTLTADHDLSALVAPVRPTLNSHYPLTPFERYVKWEGVDGSPFDPWLRVHWRFGAERLRIIPQSMIVTGTVTEWEAWTGLRFPETSVYVVPRCTATDHNRSGQESGALQRPEHLDAPSDCTLKGCLWPAFRPAR